MPKIVISRAYGAGEEYPHQIINKPIYAGTHSCCNETYIVIGPFKSEDIAKNVLSYLKTRFLRFMVMLKKPAQDALKKCMDLSLCKIFLSPGPMKSSTPSMA